MRPWNRLPAGQQCLRGRGEARSWRGGPGVMAGYAKGLGAVSKQIIRRPRPNFPGTMTNQSRLTSAVCGRIGTVVWQGKPLRAFLC